MMIGTYRRANVVIKKHFSAYPCTHLVDYYRWYGMWSLFDFHILANELDE